MVLLLLFFAMFVVATMLLLVDDDDGGCLNFGGCSLYYRHGWYKVVRSGCCSGSFWNRMGNGKCGSAAS